jgi:hypothetical protein
LKQSVEKRWTSAGWGKRGRGSISNKAVNNLAPHFPVRRAAGDPALNTGELMVFNPVKERVATGPHIGDDF